MEEKSQPVVLQRIKWDVIVEERKKQNNDKEKCQEHKNNRQVLEGNKKRSESLRCQRAVLSSRFDWLSEEHRRYVLHL